jgi:hypothetical protein
MSALVAGERTMNQPGRWQAGLWVPVPWVAGLCLTVLAACGSPTEPAHSGGGGSPAESSASKPGAKGSPARIFLPDNKGFPWSDLAKTWEGSNPDCAKIDDCISFTFVADGKRVSKDKLDESCEYQSKSPNRNEFKKGDKVTLTFACEQGTTEPTATG